MERHPLVSVILPVYNAEQFLHATLNSLLNQTLKEIEIICVDDGSTDSSVEIINEYARRDRRVMCLQQENQGAGTARNLGLEAAQGEYVHFLDADDYMLKDACEAMYRKAIEFRADIIKAKAYAVDEQSGKELSNPLYELQEIMPEDFNRVFCYRKEAERFLGKISVVPWNGLYRRNFLLEKCIRFNSLKCVNDRSFFVHAVICAERMALIESSVVCHRVNMSSSLVGQRVKNFECQFQSYKIIEEICEGLDDRLKASILSRELQDIFNWYARYKRVPQYSQKIVEGLKEFFHKIDLNYIIRNANQSGWREKWQMFEQEFGVFQEEAYKDGPKVSVIVPVYNASAYLKECLDSIVSQTLREIEIICVDDGSTDNSVEILNEYAQIDPRVSVICQENSSAGAARNNGLSRARGKYLSFLDSDDFFEPDMLEKAYQHAEKKQLQITVFRSERYYHETGKKEPMKWTINTSMLPGKAVFSMDDIPKNRYHVFNGWAWDKLFLHSFIQKSELTFQVQRTSNDVFFVWSALMKAHRIGVLNKVFVHQRKQGGSLQATREKSWDCFYHARLKMKEQLQQWGYWTWIERDFINHTVSIIFRNLDTLQEETRRLLFNKLNQEYLFDIGITTKARAYYYNKKEYGRLMELVSKSYEQYSGTETEKKTESAHVFLSVIIPCIGKKEAVYRTLDSIGNQTLGGMETLCVFERGSSVQDLAEEYAQKHTFVKLIAVEKSSFGHMVNCGLEAASGRYAAIVRTGDQIKPEAYEHMCFTAEQNKLDVLRSDYYIYEPGEQGSVREARYLPLLPVREAYDRVTDARTDSVLMLQDTNACAGIYRVQLLKENGIRMSEWEGDGWQDEGFVLKALTCADRILMKRVPDYLAEKRNQSDLCGSADELAEEYDAVYKQMDSTGSDREAIEPLYWLKRFRTYENAYENVSLEGKWVLLQAMHSMLTGKNAGMILQQLNEQEKAKADMICINPLRYHMEQFDYYSLEGRRIHKISRILRIAEKYEKENQLFERSVAGKMYSLVMIVKRKTESLFRNSARVGVKEAIRGGLFRAKNAMWKKIRRN